MRICDCNDDGLLGIVPNFLMMLLTSFRLHSIFLIGDLMFDEVSCLNRLLDSLYSFSF